MTRLLLLGGFGLALFGLPWLVRIRFFLRRLLIAAPVQPADQRVTTAVTKTCLLPRTLCVEGDVGETTH